MNAVWNLDPIYKGFDDPAFEKDMSALKEKVNEIIGFAETLASCEPVEGLRQGIAMQEAFSNLVGKLAGYASLRQSANTRDPEAEIGRAHV